MAAVGGAVAPTSARTLGSVADPALGSIRVLRTLLLALVTVALAAGAHTYAGGHVPSALLLGVLLPLVALPLALLTGRRLRLPVVLTTLGIGQLGLHHLFMWLATGSGAALDVTTADCGHVVHGSVLVANAGPLPQMAHEGDTWMVLAHAVATLLIALLVGYGERLVFSVWDVCRAALPACPTIRLALGEWIPVTAPAGIRPVLVPHAVPFRRGPPGAL